MKRGKRDVEAEAHGTAQVLGPVLHRAEVARGQSNARIRCAISLSPGKMARRSTSISPPSERQLSAGRPSSSLLLLIMP